MLKTADKKLFAFRRVMISVPSDGETGARLLVAGCSSAISRRVNRNKFIFFVIFWDGSITVISRAVLKESEKTKRQMKIPTIWQAI